MSRPVPDSEGGRSFPAECAHTHLFAGARCRIRNLPDPQGFVEAPVPLGVMLCFSDGVSVPAELLVADRGDLALVVEEHTTAAGTAAPERIWQIRENRLVAGEVEVVVGARQDLGLSELGA